MPSSAICTWCALSGLHSMGHSMHSMREHTKHITSSSCWKPLPTGLNVGRSSTQWQKTSGSGRRPDGAHLDGEQQ